MTLALLGFVLALLGACFGYIQWRRAEEIDRLRKEQSIASIKRAKDLMVPGDVVERVIRDDGPTSKEEMRQWLWTLHRGALDNYVTAVNNFLASEKTFTSQDLGRVLQAGIISKGWEEDVWHSLVALRPESRSALVVFPEDYTVGTGTVERVLDERRALESRPIAIEGAPEDEAALSARTKKPSSARKRRTKRTRAEAPEE